MQNIIVTGGSGFIGSAVIRNIIQNTQYNVLNIDKLTYAANIKNIGDALHSPRYQFLKKDICDITLIKDIIAFDPDCILHLAAESHVDRSLDEPNDFIKTNINGTFNLLQIALKLYQKKPNYFKFIHVSTDEVFGDLKPHDAPFTETTPYKPSSPYSASKAASDHLARAWHRSYGLPVIVTNCSNNYGPYQYPEKLIPVIIFNALEGKKIPIYGDGKQIRDWLFVEDHADALLNIAQNGVIGDTYNIGGHNEKNNLDVVKFICTYLDKKISNKPNNISSFTKLIDFVADRPGHDKRYAIDASYIEEKLSWRPRETFVTGMEKTIDWFLDNQQFWTKKDR